MLLTFFFFFYNGFTELPPNHQSTREWLLAKLTIYWNSVLHLEVAPVSSIILEWEQCMDVNTNSRREWVWAHFSSLAIHLSSLQPEERLLPPRSLIKQEGINNRCLRTREGEEDGRGGEDTAYWEKREVGVRKKKSKSQSNRAGRFRFCNWCQ